MRIDEIIRELSVILRDMEDYKRALAQSQDNYYKCRLELEQYIDTESRSELIDEIDSALGDIGELAINYNYVTKRRAR